AEPLASNRPAANASSEVVCRSVMAKLSLCEPKAAIIPRTFYLRAGGEPMRTVTAMMALLVTLATAAWAAEDERDKKVAEQKKQAEAAWKSLEAGDFAFVETKHLLVYAPKESEKQLKAKAATLESYHDKAVAATGLDVKDGYPGKITVYLLDKDQVTAFTRRVEKRMPMKGQTASFKADDGMLHAAAGAGGKGPVEARAGEMVAAVILARKA